MLTWVSIYWFSRAGPAASVRIYYELALTGEVISFPKTTVPVGLSFFPKDIVQFPKACVPMRPSGYTSRLMKADGRGAVCYVPKVGLCLSRSTRSADTLRLMSSPKHSSVTFAKCSARRVLQKVSSRGVPAIERNHKVRISRVARDCHCNLSHLNWL